MQGSLEHLFPASNFCLENCRQPQKKQEHSKYNQLVFPIAAQRKKPTSAFARPPFSGSSTIISQSVLPSSLAVTWNQKFFHYIEAVTADV